MIVECLMLPLNCIKHRGPRHVEAMDMRIQEFFFEKQRALTGRRCSSRGPIL